MEKDDLIRMLGPPVCGIGEHIQLYFVAKGLGEIQRHGKVPRQVTAFAGASDSPACRAPHHKKPLRGYQPVGTRGASASRATGRLCCAAIAGVSVIVIALPSGCVPPAVLPDAYAGFTQEVTESEPARAFRRWPQLVFIRVPTHFLAPARDVKIAPAGQPVP